MNNERWQSRIEQAIQQAIQHGQIEHLPGAGRPLNLHDDPNVPDDMRLAYKIMAANNVAPDWIMLGKTLGKKESDLHKAIAVAIETSHKIANPNAHWRTSKQTLQAKVDAYNTEVLSYNLKVPAGIPHKPLFDLEQAINQAQS